MKILMLLDNEFSPDIRVENEASSLIKRNHLVHILSYNYGTKAKNEYFNNIRVRRFNIHKQIAKKAVALIHIFPLYKIIWRIQVFKILNNEHFDAVHIHDLPLCFLIKSVKKKWNIKVIADMHENYPFLIKEQAYMKFFVAKIFLNIVTWHKKEKEWLSVADTIICVVEEMKERLSSVLNSATNIVIVPNTVNLNYFNDLMRPNPNLKNKYNNSFKLLYIGGFDPGRGIEYLLDATAYLKNKIPDIKIILVGDGKIALSLKEKVHSLELDNYVEFEGWQPMYHMRSYIENADICIIPHIRTPQTDNSSPNKLFQYMYYKKPVVASNCISIEKIINSENCGLIFKDRDSIDLSKQVIELYNSPELRQKMGENGFWAVNKKYNWDATVEPLLNIYQD
jgi:glycosyltransferase involved in cell wall biosynthesis